MNLFEKFFSKNTKEDTSTKEEKKIAKEDIENKKEAWKNNESVRNAFFEKQKEFIGESNVELIKNRVNQIKEATGEVPRQNDIQAVISRYELLSKQLSSGDKNEIMNNALESLLPQAESTKNEKKVDSLPEFSQELGSIQDRIERLQETSDIIELENLYNDLVELQEKLSTYVPDKESKQFETDVKQYDEMVNYLDDIEPQVMDKIKKQKEVLNSTNVEAA